MSALPTRARSPIILQDAVADTADGTTLVLKNDHANLVAISVEGTITGGGVGTLYPEVCLDPNLGTPVWYGVTGRNVVTNAPVTSITAVGHYVFEVSGFLAFRARFTKASGTPAVTVRAWNVRGSTTNLQAIISVALDPGNGGGVGRKTSTTPGTAVALASTAACRRVIVQALWSNTNPVAVGLAAGVKATVGSEAGIKLNPGGSAAFDIDDIAKVYMDPITSGEGVSFTYLTD